MYCFLAQNGFKAEGIDISTTAIIIAGEEVRKRELNITYRTADVCRDLRPNEMYNLVVDAHCLHCIVADEDRHRALTNIRQTLRENGALASDHAACKARGEWCVPGGLPHELKWLNSDRNQYNYAD